MKKYIKLMLCFLYCYAFAASNTNSDGWTIINNIQKRTYHNSFEIKFYDDYHALFDYQSGTIYWYKDGSSKIITTKPVKHIIWYKDDIMTDYLNDDNKVILSPVNNINANSIYELLMLNEAELKKIYKLTLQNDSLLLIPKEKSFIKSVQLYFNGRHVPYRFVVTDNLNYQIILTLTGTKSLNKQTGNHVEYSKNAEVIDHVRHTII